MSLQDQYLQQVLKNAPDRDLAPNDAVRATVLTYANQTVKCREKTWLNRISNLLREWLGVSWHMAGVGSAVATVLVVVVFWHELPDDAISNVAMPSEEVEIAATDSVIEQGSEAASVNKSLNRASDDDVAPAQELSAKIVENKTTFDVQPSKEKFTRLISPENRESLANVDQPVLKNNGLVEVIPQLAAPVVIALGMPATASPAPAPITQDKALVADAASSAEVSSETTKGELAKGLQAKSGTSLSDRKENMMAKKPSAKADVFGASVPKVVTKPYESQVLLARIENEGGKVAANQDIQAGNLRLLKIEAQYADLDGHNCPQLTSQVTAIDALTGYKIESVENCAATDLLRKEVEVYNQTMRDWHNNHVR